MALAFGGGGGVKMGQKVCIGNFLLYVAFCLVNKCSLHTFHFQVAYERMEKIGQSIGYQIRLESRVSPRTVLTYCTNGVLLRTLMGGDTALTGKRWLKSFSALFSKAIWSKFNRKTFF